MCVFSEEGINVLFGVEAFSEDRSCATLKAVSICASVALVLSEWLPFRNRQKHSKGIGLAIVLC